MKKSIEITLEQAKELYESGFQNLALEAFTEEELFGKQYPMSYGECTVDPEIPDLEDKLKVFNELVVIRNAWWKIDQWKPDWNDSSQIKYSLHASYNKIIQGSTISIGFTFVFGSEDTQEKFLKAFKNELEYIKEFL